MRSQISMLMAGRRGELSLRRLYLAYRERLPDGLLTPDDRKARQYDLDALRIAEQTMSSGSNFVDAGAHLGTMLKKLVAVAPGGKSYAFEPLPAFCRELELRFPNVTVEQIALGDREGSADFNYLVNDPAKSSLYARPNREEGRTVQELTVRVRRLDDCIPDDVRIDFMKVDVEGAELQLFKGASRVLTRDRPVIVFECPSSGIAGVEAYLRSTSMRVSLLSSYLSGEVLSPTQLVRAAKDRGEYYFVASPSETQGAT